MTRDEAAATVRAVIEEVVPGADASALAPDENFRERLEMDSLDFLTFIEALGERTGLPLPEQDYPALGSLDGCAAYVAARTGGGTTREHEE